MLLMRRELRDKVPSILVKTNTVYDQHVRDRDAASKNKSKIYTDQHVGTPPPQFWTMVAPM